MLGGNSVSKSYKLFVSLFATVMSLLSLAAGIMLVNSLTFGFWQMIGYDLIFVGQFFTFLWCAIIYYRNLKQDD